VIVVGSSEYLCFAGGRFCRHSIESLVCVGHGESYFEQFCEFSNIETSNVFYCILFY
jgi:hypothetical protein